MIVTAHKGIVGDVLKAIQDAGSPVLIKSIQLSRAEMDEFVKNVPRDMVGKYYGTEEIPQLLNIKHNRDGSVSEFYYSSVHFFCTESIAVDD